VTTPTRTRRRRGVKRRTEILEATLRLLAREGAAPLTMRAVAAEATVPLTATTYYFESKGELILEAWRLHAEREAARVSRATEAIASMLSPPEIADRMARFVQDGLGPARESLLAEFELLVQAARQPELEELTRVWHQAVREHVREVLAAAGSPQPELDARLVVAITAGLEVDNLGAADAMSLDELRELFRRVLGALLQ
jgi:DNA-binding transcriptional regulator YbjK